MHITARVNIGEWAVFIEESRDPVKGIVFDRWYYAVKLDSNGKKITERFDSPVDAIEFAMGFLKQPALSVWVWLAKLSEKAEDYTSRLGVR